MGPSERRILFGFRRGKVPGSLSAGYLTWMPNPLRFEIAQEVFKQLDPCKGARTPDLFASQEDHDQKLPFSRLTGLESTSQTLDRKLDQGSWKETLHRLDRPGILVDSATYASLLRWCGNGKALSDGKRVHDHIIKSGLERNMFLGSLIVEMYGKCGALDDARALFAKMHQRNVFSWNFMIRAYARHGQGREALQLFEQMQLEGVMPDKFTFVSILSACASLAALGEGERMHGRIMGTGFDSDVVVATALVNMYAKCGSLEDARRMFDKMPERDVISWNAMIAAYAQQGQGYKALQLFGQMQREGVMPDKFTFPSILDACASQAALAEGERMHARIMGSGFKFDVVIGNALVSMYGKCGSLDDARRMFDKLHEQNVVSWTAMIAAYAQHGQGKEALQLFDQMQREGVMPNKVTFASILDACASQAALAEGVRMHARIMGSGFKSDVVVGNALVSMYGKCGSLEDARKMFDRMPERDVVSWTAMIAAYAQHGQGKEALQLFDHMQQEGVMPDQVTFVSILSACSHAGMVDEGCHYFVSMSRDHGITPTVDHYSCMIDILGRAGRLDEAEDLINNMPFQPTIVSWMTLLAACRSQVDVERGERAAKHVFELDPENTALHVMLSNIYVAAGRGDDAAKVINWMMDKGLKKQRG